MKKMKKRDRKKLSLRPDDLIISEHELERLQNAIPSSLDGLVGFLFSAAITLAITLLTAPLQDWLKGVLGTLMIVCAISAAIRLIVLSLRRSELRALIQKIKERNHDNS